MAITINQIYQDYKEQYSLELLAGKQGIDETISWIYLLEDWQIAPFLHGNELVITTGILSDSLDWLLVFCRSLIINKAAGLIINIGHYITSVSDEVISYCNTNNFPLIIMPWEMHLTDASRTLCNVIQEDEKTEFMISTAFHNAILYPDARQTYDSVLTQHNFLPNASYYIVCLRSHSNKSFDKKFIPKIHHTLNRFHFVYSLIPGNEELIFVFYETDMNIIESALTTLSRNHSTDSITDFCFGIGSEVKSFYDLNYSYEKAHICAKQAIKQNRAIIKFSSPGLEKLLLSVHDQTLFDLLLTETISPIIEYDREHDTNYLKVLRLYIEFDSNIQTIANTMYTHRNTINYRMRKIKEILNRDFSTMEEKVLFQVAFYILDLKDMDDHNNTSV